jgi:hypothetical protein
MCRCRSVLARTSGTGLINQGLQRTLPNHLTALMPGAGANINHLVGTSNRFFIMLHHE